MSNPLATTLIGAALALAALTSAAAAQGICREGRTADGKCVNAALAAGARQNANILSQEKISITAYPILPSQDYGTFRPVDAQRFELSQPGNFSTNPVPRSP